MSRAARTWLVFTVVLTVLGVLYLLAPESWGGLVFMATAGIGLLALLIGPQVRRPQHPGAWRWLAAAGACFLVGLVLRFELLTWPGPAGQPDLWAFVGYACLALTLTGLLRRTHLDTETSITPSSVPGGGRGWLGRGSDLWLDTAAVTAGSVLIGWVMNIAPNLTDGQADLGTVVINTIYPIADTALITLTVQLWLRRGSQNVALQAGLVGLSALLAGDLGYTFVWASDPGAVNVYVNVFYLFAYAGLGLMAVHPSMKELSDVDVFRRPLMSRARLILIFLAMITPACIPIMRPTHGTTDAVVRAVLMAVFGGLVFLRLLTTIGALQLSREAERYRATHDMLTGLPKREPALRGLADMLSAGAPVTVASIDCDRFHNVNDSWGRPAGDQVLIEIADRLAQATRPGEQLARLGEDEFLLASPGFRPDDVITRVRGAFAEPFHHGEHRESVLTTSIGVARVEAAAPSPSSHDGANRQERATDLVNNAGTALRDAKGDGPGSASIYDARMSEAIERRLKVTDLLHNALARNEIHVAYQPIRTGPSYGLLSGWEALARWDNPELGTVSPGEFIPLAEKSDVIVDIGAYVLRTAAAQLCDWQDRLGRTDLHMSVNLSTVQLRRDDAVALVQSVLRENDLQPESIWLELTESALLSKTEHVLSTLQTLTAIGVNLSMDDFGTGYSALAYLKDFTVHTLKIDRAFIKDIATEPRDRALAQAIIDMAASLQIGNVVAEGIETEEQARILVDVGCTSAQGYFYGKPLPPRDAFDAAQKALAEESAPNPIRYGPTPPPQRRGQTDGLNVEATDIGEGTARPGQ